MFVEYRAMKSVIDAVVNAGYGLPTTADPATADVLLQSAGYKKLPPDQQHQPDDKFYLKAGEAGGTPEILTATITVNAAVAKDIDAANELATQWNAAGVKTNVVAVPNTEYWGKTVPNGNYEMVYGWLSCGSVAEPYSSMSRYAVKAIPINQRSPGFSNTGRWSGPAADAYADAVAEFRDLPLNDASIPHKVAAAYKFLADEMPFIPLVQSPKIIPFNTKYWTGWPTANQPTNVPFVVPMHSWGATQRLIHRLEPQ